jgi:methylmalonyl-CoA mutase
VDVVGISSLGGAHAQLVPELAASLRRLGMAGTPLVVGGIIPPEDAPRLRQAGVAAIFGPGSTADQIADELAGLIRLARARREALVQEQ